MTTTASTATMSPVDVARHAAAYRLHAHADNEQERARERYDQYTSRGLNAAFAALADGGHRPLAAALQGEAYARKALRKLLDQPDDGSDVVRDAVARYERCRQRVQAGLDELR